MINSNNSACKVVTPNRHRPHSRQSGIGSCCSLQRRTLLSHQVLLNSSTATASFTSMDRPEKKKQGDKDGKGLFGKLMSLPRKSPRPMEIQDPMSEPSRHTEQLPTKVQVQDRSSQAPKMSSLHICCLIEDDDLAFRVEVRTDAEVIKLHKLVQSERDLDILQGVSPYRLELWKVCL
jgi:hypothetical protein